jgi:hypothetical protein
MAIQIRAIASTAAFCALSITSLDAAARTPQQPAAAPVVFQMRGTLLTPDGQPRTGSLPLRASVYAQQLDDVSLWSEIQEVTLDASGRYALNVGMTDAAGVPLTLFASGAGRWIGIGVVGETEQTPRTMLISVPYAVKASDADTLGGKTPADFLLVSNLRSALQSQGSGGLGNTPGTSVITSTNAIAKSSDTAGSVSNSVMSEVGGLIGVGTLSPGSPLHIVKSDLTTNGVAPMLTLEHAGRPAGGGFGSGIDFVQTQNTGLGSTTIASIQASFVTPGSGNAGMLDFRTNDAGGAPASRMMIDNVGNVGIGTTAPATPMEIQKTDTSSATVATLLTLRHTSSTGVSGGGFGSAIDFVQTNNSGQGSTKVASIQSYFATPGNGNSGVLDFRTADAGTTPVSRMVINNFGNVGIGTSSPTARLDVTGNINVSGNINAKYQDVAEWVETPTPLEAGTVVIVDPDGSNRVLKSARAYDTRVAGAVSKQPGLILGEAGDTKAMVAQSGRVRIKVDARYGAVKVGDLLVTSPTPGYAMKSRPVLVGGVWIHRAGTLLGKALEALPNGKGEILVLLTLQ